MCRTNHVKKCDTCVTVFLLESKIQLSFFFSEIHFSFGAIREQYEPGRDS